MGARGGRLGGTEACGDAVEEVLDGTIRVIECSAERLDAQVALKAHRHHLHDRALEVRAGHFWNTDGQLIKHENEVVPKLGSELNATG